jgi:hypothetical protein
MKVLRKDLVHLFLQAKEKSAKTNNNDDDKPCRQKKQRWGGTHPQEVKGK